VQLIRGYGNAESSWGEGHTKMTGELEPPLKVRREKAPLSPRGNSCKLNGVGNNSAMV
jgi:hypothetical protein